MSFLNPLLLLGALGIALPIVAHLLNRFEVRQTDWAAMQFLNRNVSTLSQYKTQGSTITSSSLPYIAFACDGIG